MKPKEIVKIAVICTLAFSLYTKGKVYAQEAEAYRGDVYEQKNPAWGPSGHWRQRRDWADGRIDKRTLIAFVFESLPVGQREELIKLRENNPQKFKEVIEPKLRQQSEYLKKLRESNPQAFKEAVGEVRQRLRKKRMMKMFVFETLPENEKDKLSKLRQTDPEKFREVIKGKFQQQGQRLRKLKEENPQKFKEISDRIKTKAKKHRLIRAAVFESLSEKEKQELIQLKKSDPKKFKQVLHQKLNEKMEYLQNLKETNPRKFEEIQTRIRKKVIERLHTLREKNPEKFAKIMSKNADKRKKRMKELCKTDLKKCQELKSRRIERIKSMLQDLKEEDPESYQKIRHFIARRREHRRDTLDRDDYPRW